MSYYITTTDTQRRADWRRIFDTDRLPVLSEQPRPREVAGCGEALAYDLDLSAFHPFARKRLAAHVARRTRRDYAVVWAGMRTAVSWPIDAVDCEAVVPDRERPFFVPDGWGRVFREGSSHNHPGMYRHSKQANGEGLYAEMPCA